MTDFYSDDVLLCQAEIRRLRGVVCKQGSEIEELRSIVRYPQHQEVYCIDYHYEEGCGIKTVLVRGYYLCTCHKDMNVIQTTSGEVRFFRDIFGSLNEAEKHISDAADHKHALMEPDSIAAAGSGEGL